MISNDIEERFLPVTPHTYVHSGGRLMFWTGRVCIGLRYYPAMHAQVSDSMSAIQNVLLDTKLDPLPPATSVPPQPPRWKRLCNAMVSQQVADVVLAALLAALVASLWLRS